MPHSLLLADDSVTIRRVIELTFADESVRVTSVSTGREAIAAIEAQPPDIILADAGMPDVSGYDLAALVKGRADLRHIPVILLAGAFEPLDEARARKSGSDGVLVKPFEPQMVVARVRELLSKPAAAPVLPPPVMPSPLEASPSADSAPMPIDPLFDASLDRLDAAFSNTGSQMPSLDATTATDFANDLRELRSTKVDSGGFERQDFGDWDLPVRGTPDAARSFDAISPREPDADVFAAPPPEPVTPPLPPPITLAPKPQPPAPPLAAPQPAAAMPSPAAMSSPHAVPASPPALADAFSNLLAAEEGRPHAPLRGAIADAVPANAALTDADVDAIADRVIARLGSGVRGAVIDLAERLVKAEIDRLKAMR